ncbi:XRE family transcriptional regulator, partial [Staphylococcus pseudintermedius]|nr:XRE family transcriptional regulator [Staphylococcus pseudintermedius]
LEEIEGLKEQAIKIGKRLRLAPNKQYEAIKGEPMYKLFLYKYPDRLEAQKNNILEKGNS